MLNLVSWKLHMENFHQFLRIGVNLHILGFEGESDTIVRNMCYISVEWQFLPFLPNDRYQFLERKNLFSSPISSIY